MVAIPSETAAPSTLPIANPAKEKDKGMTASISKYLLMSPRGELSMILLAYLAKRSFIIVDNRANGGICQIILCGEVIGLNRSG